MLEYFYMCPHCWQKVSLLVDTSIKDQTLIEDCEVCCNPIQFNICSDGNKVVNFNAKSIGQ